MDISYDKYLSYLSDRFNIEKNQFQENIEFTSLGIDSLALYSLIGDIEKEFNIKLAIEDILSINTIGKMYEYVSNRCEQ